MRLHGRSRSKLTGGLAIVLASGLSACGGSSPAPSLEPCPPAPTLAFEYGQIGLVGAQETSPLSPATTVLSFSTTNETLVGGMPVLTGSDGSRIVGSELAVAGTMPTGGGPTSVASFYSLVTGLHPNVTYAIDFPSLVGPTVGGRACDYPAQAAGSFVTTGS